MSQQRTNFYDLANILNKGILGALPFLGPMLSEIIGILIPKQRIDRIQMLLENLEEKISKIEKEKFELKIKDPVFLDLIEEGFVKATRSVSEDRIKGIASVIANGVDKDGEKLLGQKHLLNLLSEVNDIELIWLRAFARHPSRDKEFREKHSETLRPLRIVANLPPDEEERQVIVKSYYDHLERLGLISNKSATSLGRLMLINLGMLKEDEY